MIWSIKLKDLRIQQPGGQYLEFKYWPFIEENKQISNYVTATFHLKLCKLRVKRFHTLSEF